jgi:hypothetical protein
MKTYLVKVNVTPRVILRAKQRAKDCMSRTKDPEECRVHFELVDSLTLEMMSKHKDEEQPSNNTNASLH